MTMNNYSTIYEAVGGAEGVQRIVGAFYPKVQKHPLLGPLFPSDITPLWRSRPCFYPNFLADRPFIPINTAIP